jgi:hypothetical protein
MAASTGERHKVGKDRQIRKERVHPRNEAKDATKGNSYLNNVGSLCV